MNKDLIQQILGKLEKSFYEDSFCVSGSAGYANNENDLIENYSEHTNRYLNHTYTDINRFLNKKPGVNYLDPNDPKYEKENYDYNKGSSNFPLENLVSDILNIVKDMKPQGTPTTVYRGTYDHYYPMLDDCVVGQTLSLKSITSTSTTQSVADIFANIYDGMQEHNSLVFKINIPSEMPTIKVKTEQYDEDEIILHPAEYKIKNIETFLAGKNAKYRLVTLEPTRLLDIKPIILDGLDQAKQNHLEAINKWMIERNRGELEDLGINPDTAVDHLIKRVEATPSPSPQTLLIPSREM